MNLLRPENNHQEPTLGWTQPLFNHLMNLSENPYPREPNPIDLVRQVIKHQLVPVYLRSGHPSLADLDARDREGLFHLSQTNTSRVLTMVSRFRSPVEALDRGGIRYAVYKGPTLALQAFGDLAARQFGDIDLLIHPQDFLAACDILTSLGFQNRLSLSPFVRAYIRKSHRDFTMSHGELRLDLHQQIARGPAYYALPEEAWSGLGRVPLLKGTVPTLPMDLEKVLLTVHAARHGWDSYKLVLDLAGLFQRFPDTDWTRIDALVARFQARAMFDLGISLVRTHFPDLAPGHIPRTHPRVLKAALERHAHQLDRGEYYTDMGMLKQFFHLQDSRFNRIRMALFYLSYPRPEDPILQRFNHGALIHLMPLVTPPYLALRALSRQSSSPD